MRYIVLIVLSFLMTLSAEGQKPQLQFKQLTLDDGLSSSSITCIHQDSKGYMWIGTSDGLNRYDGYTFKIYKNNPSNPNSLSHNFISVIVEDRNKNIFIGTSNGLSMYTWNSDNFFNYMYESTSPFYGLNFIIRYIELDSLDNMWLSTDIGLLYFDRNKNTNTSYSHNPEDKFSISSNDVECTFMDDKGRLWVSTRCGLNLFQPASGHFNHIKSCYDRSLDISDTYFQKIVQDHDENIWIGSYEGLFYCKNSAIRDAEELPDLMRFAHIPGDPSSLSNNRVLSLYVDNEGKLWIGTENGGLNLFDPTTQTFFVYKTDPYNMKSLNNESIKVITQDKTGNLWVGTFAGGVNISNTGSGAILLYTNLPGAPLSLSHNVVTGFLEDHNKNIWVTTDGGGLNQFNKKTGRFIRLNSENSNLNSNVILSMIEDSKNRIWMGTWAGGLNLFNTETGKFKAYTTKNSGIPENDIFAVAQGEDNDLWLGGLQTGLIHYDINKNTFENYSPTNSTILNQMVNVIRKDINGTFYIGTASGLSIKKKGSNNFINYPPTATTPDRLGYYSIMDILIQNDSAIWIGGSQGLYLLNPYKNELKHQFEKNDPLYNSAIRGLALDENNMLWITTTQGVCRFDYKNGTYRLFTKADGLQSNEFNAKSILKLDDQTILMGGTRGFNLIRPDQIVVNTHIPKILITGFQIFNEDVPLGVKGSPLTRHISKTSQIVLSHDQTVLTFFYAAMDFTMPEKNQYAYIMEGFDDRWHYVGNKTEATYTNLDPGTYTFRVKGSNNDGIWNEKGTSLKIIIRPPWWETILFRTLTILLIITLIIGFYYLRISQLKRQKDLLEKMVKERTKEIENKNAVLHQQKEELNEINTLLEERQQRIEEQTEELKIQADELAVTNKKLLTLNATKDKFFSIIAHDLKNPFTSILGFCEILISRYGKYDDTKRLHLIKVINQSAEHIFKLLENLLQWSRSQTGNIKFDPEEFNLAELINSNIMLIENMVKEKKLKVEVAIPEDLRVFADKNMINTVIRNLLTNAVKFTESGSIQLIAAEDKTMYKISVRDSGVGMDQERAASLFKIGGSKSTEGTRGETGTGLGLIICKEFVEKNKGQIGVESESGKGSEFYFTLPKSKMKNR